MNRRAFLQSLAAIAAVGIAIEQAPPIEAAQPYVHATIPVPRSTPGGPRMVRIVGQDASGRRIEEVLELRGSVATCTEAQFASWRGMSVEVIEPSDPHKGTIALASPPARPARRPSKRWNS